MPLAIGLAAARVRLLGVDGLRAKLGKCLEVLAHSGRPDMPRHQTLRATLDWSYSLLLDEERRVFRSLSVFIGGFSLDLAEEVCSEAGTQPWFVADTLASLIDKSLVTVDESDPPRYNLLEPTRAYAAEKLTESGSASAVLERHAYAVARFFVNTRNARYRDGDITSAEFLQRVVPEVDNALRALDWAIAGSRWDVAVALSASCTESFRANQRIAQLLSRMSVIRFHSHECTDHVELAKFWRRLAFIGTHVGLPKTEILEAAEKAVRLSRKTNSLADLHAGLYALAWALNDVGQPDGAEQLLPEIERLGEAINPKRRSAAERLLLSLQASIRNRQGRFAEASVLLRKELALLRERGEESTYRNCQTRLCWNLIGLREFTSAKEIAEEVIALSKERGAMTFASQHLMIAETFLGRSDIALELLKKHLPSWIDDGTFSGFAVAATIVGARRFEEAARVLGAARAAMDLDKRPLHPVDEQCLAFVLERFEAADLKPGDIELWKEAGAHLDEAGLASLLLSTVAS